MNMYFIRLLQRCIYNIILNKYQYLAVCVCVLVIISFSHLGEILNDYVTDENPTIKYCGEPIDVVYTWVNGSDTKFKKSLKNYLIDGKYMSKDYSDERFDDKYELKFSLRSLEIYAPWVRRVYIVTNGQIPYWLNLDFEKVSIITHEDIFFNLDNLPTFSSPAIESNIHRIPGLSNKFIYFNDDIFLGAPTYPEDFYSPNRGYLIYLAWPLPSCVPNCPWVFVGDGQCDTSCYNSECQFDGGDCANSQDSSKFNSNLFLHEKEEEENSEELKHSIDYDYYDDDQNHKVFKRHIYKTNSNKISQNVTRNNSSTTNPNLYELLKRKQNLVTLKTKLLSNETHVSNIIHEHNKNVILNDKLKRKKRLFKNLRKRYYQHKFNSTNTSILNKNNTRNGYDNNKKKNTELDTYALSLQYTNRIFNLAYGYKARKVPAHSPTFIDKTIMENMQKKFFKEFQSTEKNRLRSENDMQYSFSYYYYLISEKMLVNISEIFDMFDTDSSSTWSDREIRTLLTRMNDLPLNYGMVEMFDNAIINCSKTVKVPEVTVPPYERYIDSKLPVVSKQLVLNCPVLMNMLNNQFHIKPKYKYEIMKNAQSQHVMFKMLSSNISDVVGHLDEIRKGPRKFICLNDNMNPKKYEENDLVKAVLLDFYLSLFPKPSKFELPQEYRNRFSYVKDLSQWKQYHIKLKLFLFICVTVICIMSFYNICKRKLLRQVKRIVYF